MINENESFSPKHAFSEDRAYHVLSRPGARVHTFADVFVQFVHLRLHFAGKLCAAGQHREVLHDRDVVSQDAEDLPETRLRKERGEENLEKWHHEQELCHLFHAVNVICVVLCFLFIYLFNYFNAGVISHRWLLFEGFRIAHIRRLHPSKSREVGVVCGSVSCLKGDLRQTWTKIYKPSNARGYIQQL